MRRADAFCQWAVTSWTDDRRLVIRCPPPVGASSFDLLASAACQRPCYPVNRATDISGPLRKRAPTVTLTPHPEYLSRRLLPWHPALAPPAPPSSRARCCSARWWRRLVAVVPCTVVRRRSSSRYLLRGLNLEIQPRRKLKLRPRMRLSLPRSRIRSMPDRSTGRPPCSQGRASTLFSGSGAARQRCARAETEVKFEVTG